MSDLLHLPPQALEAEMAVLGSMLILRDAADRAIELLSEEDFYKDAHRKIFHAAVELQRRNQAVDEITVGDALRASKLLGDVGGGQYLLELTSKVSTAAHVEHYANIVREKSILRDVIKTCTEVVGQAHREEKPPAELLDEVQARILSVAQRTTVSSIVAAKDVAHEVLSEIERLHHHKGEVTGVPSGFRKFDSMTQGFQRGDLILIAARPSQGKTALALNIVANVVMKAKAPTLLFSLEMSTRALMNRLISSESGANLKDIRSGFFKRERWTDITNATARLADSPLYFDDSSYLSVLDIRSRARRKQLDLAGKGEQLGLIVIDYLQLLRGPNRRVENRQQEVADISRGLKALARDLNVPVVALAQLNRRTEDKGRPDNRPLLSDLRDSGSLEQDADLVALIHREGYYKRDDPSLVNSAELIIAKQRNGPVGTVDLAWVPELTRFENKELGAAPDSEEDTQVTFS